MYSLITNKNIQHKIGFDASDYATDTMAWKQARKLNIGNGLSNFELELYLAPRVAYFDKQAR